MARPYLWSVLLLAAGVLGVLASSFGQPVFPFGLCAYLIMMLLPGAGLMSLVSPESEPVEIILAGFAMSPVLVTIPGIIAMLAGVGVPATATALVIFSCVTGIIAALNLRSPRRWVPTIRRREALALFILIAAVCVAISYLPFTREWWRMRSDAWFHSAIVAQIKDFGIPPEDPFNIGFPLQYMWFFHVFVVLVSQASGIHPFFTMAVVNVHALAGFALAAFLFSATYRKSFSQNYAAVLTVLFGMNAAFWAFIPVKLLRMFFGNVRGAEDFARLASLHPFQAITARRFVQVGYNQEFLLDKFMVATAFSMGLCLMAALWWAAAAYIVHRKREHLVAAFITATGVVAFHAVLGVVVFGGVAGGLVLMLLLRRSLKEVAPAAAVKLLAALAVSALVLAPYLYSVSYAKTEHRALPLGFSALKMLGMTVSCALVIFLFAFQAKRLFRTRDVSAYFFWCTTASIVAICAVLNLPAANSFDKLPFLPFFPLAVAGGWTIAEFARRGKTPRRRMSRYVIACLIAFAPLNLLMFSAYYHTPPKRRLSVDEEKVATWIRSATPRSSVMIDSSPNCFLLVAGPRRYYLASEGYAEVWGYDRAEIDRRKALKRNVYSPGLLEETTLETLGAMPDPVYVVVRTDDAQVDAAKFSGNPALFHRVFSSGPMIVFEVDKEACLLAAMAPGHRR
jgi:hypothetical protein